MNVDKSSNGSTRRFALLIVLMPWLLSGCATLVATSSIEPYTRDKTSRDRLEALAESYCVQKRGPDHGHPDYLFTTDGCSRWPDDGFAVCCIVHDISYWCGGSAEDRQLADASLRQCVDDRHRGWGNLIYAGVRMGGAPWLPTPWRWGYGWDRWPAGYTTSNPALSVTEILNASNARQIIGDQLQAWQDRRCAKARESCRR